MSIKFSRKILVKLFNCGKLRDASLDWLLQNGFCLLCEDGRVTNILEEE